jgi:hypothetical protein
MEADVERMTVKRAVRWASFPWLTDAVHLALTREALWSAYHTEVRRLPLPVVDRIEPGSNPLDDREATDLAEAEVLRRSYRDAESKVRLIGLLHLIVLVPLLLAAMVMVGSFLFGDQRPRTWPSIVAIGVMTALGAWIFAVNRGLRRLRAWSRWAALAEAIAVLLISAWVLTGPHGLTALALVLLTSPGMALAAYVAWFLLSRRASVLFTRSYREAVDRTPYLDPKPALSFARASQRTLRLRFRVPDDHLSRVAFRFPTVGECKRWARRLAALAARPADTAAPGGEAAPAEPTVVVLLQQRPTAQCQLLGTVEAKAYKRRTAEASLQVRAAMMGADSVVDLQEEFLPDFRQTVRRLTGTAMRAVSAEGEFELRSRWYAGRVAWVSTWTLALLLITFPLTVLGGILINAIPHAARILSADSWMTTPAATLLASNLLGQVLWSFLILAGIHIWPIGLAALARGLHWPQFVRPLALTLVAFALRPFYWVTGLMAGALLSGRWSGLIYHSLWLLDPINLSILMFGLLLGRTAWRADREFRRLVPAVARKAPPHRAIGGA